MVKSDSLYLKDISKAILKIKKYCKDVSFQSFSKEDMRHDAVIRQLMIIGEAANKLSSEFKKSNPNFPISEAVRMRNFLVHGYDDVNLEVVWKTVQEDIPLLKDNLKTF